ncbi:MULTISPECIES: hypothetical protein [unclassified Flavobacterium]|uniref:hypothetical protein n=1 Tax=unclassified Flavobacterium TaxID=196869 RepID=UPI00096202DD|nr:MULTISPECIES: hypothetical protein [unclassified Flavobacterium]MBN9285473.1 hypothetical protein [Flavobacterium sp.]OJV71464.1 MAG: hypothetical protein BGO42_06310 [Flavobacterium sp. 40-81]
MNDTFAPKINRQEFQKTILKFQNNEGADTAMINIIASKIKNAETVIFYDAFITLCKQYHVDVKCYEETKEGQTSCTIIIKKDNYDYYSMSYTARDKDVTLALAAKLYEVLSIQIQNEQFIKSIKR